MSSKNVFADPTWIYLVSDHEECGGSESDHTDIAEGKKHLEEAGIRVIATERNITPDQNKGTRSCGDKGTFVSCFLIFSDNKTKAQSLGFKSGGNCGKDYRSRTH